MQMNQKILCQYVNNGVSVSEQQQQLDNLFAFYETQSRFDKVQQLNMEHNHNHKHNYFNYQNQINQFPQQQNQEQHFNQQQQQKVNQKHINYYQEKDLTNKDKQQELNNNCYQYDQFYGQQTNNNWYNDNDDLSTNNYQYSHSHSQSLSYSSYSYNIHRKKRQNNQLNLSNSVNKSLDSLIQSQKAQINSNKPFNIKKKQKLIKDQNRQVIFYDPNKNISQQQNKDLIMFDRNTLLKKIQNRFTKFCDSKNQQSFKSEQKQLNQMLANLGIKSTNKLGKSKTQRQIKNICSYLREGILPQDYFNQFNQLIQK